MTDPSWSLQQALYQALSAALPCPVYDAVPQGAAYPYVTIDREVRRNADFLNSRLDERFVYLNVWSDYPGQKEVKEIIAAIDAALHRQPLEIADGRVVSCIVRDTDTSRDADGVTYMGRVTLQILTQH